jgi:hypothetical protein
VYIRKASNPEENISRCHLGEKLDEGKRKKEKNVKKGCGKNKFGVSRDNLNSSSQSASTELNLAFPEL